MRLWWPWRRWAHPTSTLKGELDAAGADDWRPKPTMEAQTTDARTVIVDGPALVALRQAEGDERISEDTRARLKAVRAVADAAEDRS